MPFVSGVFSRVYSWVNDKNANIDITASRFDTEDDGFATGLSTCILKDGTQTLTASIPFGGFKITGYGTSAVPSARSDVPSLGQVEDGTVNWVAAAGSADVITAGYTPALTALVDGQLCFFRATAANATATPTFSPNGLTARTITKRGGSALIAGDIPAANAEVILRYNLANTRWEMLSPATGGLNLLQTQVASNSATIDFTTGIDATYDDYEIRLSNVVPATNAQLLCIRVAQSGTFKSGAANYARVFNILSDAGTNTVSAVTAGVGEAQITTCSGLSNTAGRGVQGSIRFSRPGVNAEFKLFRWELATFDGTNNRLFTGQGFYTPDGDAINGVRLLMNSGNITSGNFSLYGFRK